MNYIELYEQAKKYIPDLTELNQLREENMLRVRQHPTLPLLIWNYTDLCTFEKRWTPATMACRGLVTDLEGNLVARAFPKFLNIEQVDFVVPEESFEVYEKMDGSLGIVFSYQGEIVCASRGSFDSDQAVMLERIFHEKYPESAVISDFTYMFEIIFPSNRIVIDYGQRRDIVLLGAVRIKDGWEPSMTWLRAFWDFWPTTYPKTYTYSSMEEIINFRKWEMNNWSEVEEGYVVRFESGYKVKFKFAEYCRRHGLMTETSTLTIWRMLMANNGKIDADVITLIPDEYYTELLEVVNEINLHFYNIDKCVSDYVGSMYQAMQHDWRQKDIAMWVQANVPKNFHGFVFSRINGHEIDEHIWKLVRPEYRPLFKSFVTE